MFSNLAVLEWLDDSKYLNIKSQQKYNEKNMKKGEFDFSPFSICISWRPSLCVVIFFCRERRKEIVNPTRSFWDKRCKVYIFLSKLSPLLLGININ